MSERILLQQGGLTISDKEVSCSGRTIELKQIKKSWVETRRPGLRVGAMLAVLGAALLLRGAGIMRVFGLIVAAYGVLRARSEEHAVMLQIEGETTPQEALKTADGVWAREVLAVLVKARL